MRYLGLDYGARSIGLAIGDDEMRVAMPLVTLVLPSRTRALEDLSTLIRKEGIDVVVIGTPMLGGVFKKQKTLIKKFADDLLRHTGIPIHHCDESFSSKQAARLMRALSSRQSNDEHALAASIILQSYFDSRV